MTTLFDQEKIWEIELKNVAKENRETGLHEGAIMQLCSLVYRGLISLATGISESHMSETDFIGHMKKLYPDFHQ